jgi:hypothetical protein
VEVLRAGTRPRAVLLRLVLPRAVLAIEDFDFDLVFAFALAPVLPPLDTFFLFEPLDEDAILADARVRDLPFFFAAIATLLAVTRKAAMLALRRSKATFNSSRLRVGRH